MDCITENKIYLLIKLTKEKRDRIKNTERRHNLRMMIKAYNELFVTGIDTMINDLKLEGENAGQL